MLIRRRKDLPASEITDERVYLDRREFMGMAGGLGRAAASGLIAPSLLACTRDAEGSSGRQEDRLTPYEHVTNYNNYYEFGTAKEDPAQYSKDFKPRPWTVAVEGLVKKPAIYDLDALINPHRAQEHVYRLRCVEGWSMVIPWLGFPLAEMIRRFEPLPSAKYVEFTTLLDPKQMPGQRRDVLPWPYKEGLRLDEATHPLTLMVVGVYGKTLPNQNGAPLRLIVPWKYGFKSSKGIVKMRFTENEPVTTWNEAAPHEYGFYANVNPTVDHPRWSQAKERRIGEFRRRDTVLFNGYGDQVAQMYAGMDLRKHF